MNPSDLQIQKIIERGVRESLELWHTRFLPMHFEESAKRRYGYTARQGERMDRGSRAYRRSYTGRKERKFGHTKALVYTGRSRDTMTRSASYRVRTALGRASGELGMSVPAYWFLHPFRGRRFINKTAEVTRLIPSEKKALDDAFARSVISETIALIRAAHRSVA